MTAIELLSDGDGDGEGSMLVLGATDDEESNFSPENGNVKFIKIYKRSWIKMQKNLICEFKLFIIKELNDCKLRMSACLNLLILVDH